MSGERWLVVGLGNPGPKYAGNRHNVGFMVVDELAAQRGERWRSHKAHAEVVETRLGNVPVVLAKPRSYMNLSGGPVANLCSFYKVPVERVVVVHDELDIPFASLKLKRGGGSAGHNGLRSVTASLDSPDYVRVRVGIGRPPGRMDAASFVLRDFSTVERRELDVHVARAADAVETVVTAGLEKAQLVYHTAA
ncbi:aminoacyl-tRNA hydrolase [Thermobifida alba]|uniref:aminoacyl-tRNA hydrolase n=1 Tax=Thermobifida alba TaxID=53522 RepID=UPI00200A8CF9|nr:aminoacyl-tRNA hydrolase [Thermobifida alba]